MIALLALSGPGSSAQTPAARDWNLSARVFVEYDDNVALNPEDDTAGSKKGSFAPGLLVSGSWRFYEDLSWTVGAGGTAFHKQPVDDGVDDFSVTALAPRLFVERRGWPFEVPTRARASYDFGRDWVGGAGFSTSHTLAAGIAVRATRAFSIGPSLSIASTDFDDDGAEPGRTSRDADRMVLGATGSYRFGGRFSTASLSYAYAANWADGDNFDQRTHSVSARMRHPVRVPIRTALGTSPVLVSVFASYAHADYVNFVGSPRREQDNVSAGITFVLPIARGLMADLSYVHARSESNRAEFSTRRNTVTLGSTYRF